MVQIILRHLRGLYKENVAVADILTRALISATEPFDPAVLIELYDKSGFNHYLRVGISQTLSYGKTGDISSWVKRRLSEAEIDTAHHGLIYGLWEKGGFTDPREMMDFLKRIFDLYHGDATLGLFKKYGDEADYIFLKGKARTLEPAPRKKIKKLLDKKGSSPLK
jgi:hypothetical protein